MTICRAISSTCNCQSAKDATFNGVVDLLTMQARLGEDGKTGPIPDDMADAAEEARMELVEVAAEGDDELLMKYLEGEELSDEEIVAGLKGALKQGIMVPVLYCAPEPGIGVQALLDALAASAPGTPLTSNRSHQCCRRTSFPGGIRYRPTGGFHL